MTRQPFGNLPDGTPVEIYTLRDGRFEARIATYGGVVDSGRVLKVLTDQPVIQLYTGNPFDGSIQGKGGQSYAQHAAFRRETLPFPDSLNHKDFLGAELNAGRCYYTVTVFRFSAH